MSSETPNAKRLRERKQMLEGRLCDCGGAAFMCRSGDYFCLTCLELQKQDAFRRYTATAGVKVGGSRVEGKGMTELRWDGDLTGFAKDELIGWGPTEQFLKQLERKAA